MKQEERGNPQQCRNTTYLLNRLDSPLSFPPAYQKQLKHILRMSLFPPRLIYSNYGKNKAGKSFFLNSLRGNQIFNCSNENLIFSESDNGLTYYDSYYYPSTSGYFQETHGLLSKQIIFSTKIQDDISQSYFSPTVQGFYHHLDLQHKFITKQVASIHKEGRQRMKALKEKDNQQDFVEERTKEMNHRFMIYTSSEKLFNDKNFDFLNEYLVFLDRAGYNDNCLSLKEGVDEDHLQRELRRVKNQTIFYCQNASDATDQGSINRDILNILENHQLHKVIVCFNFHHRLTLPKSEKKLKQTLKEFFEAIMKLIPDNFINIFKEKIKRIKKNYFKNEQKIKELLGKIHIQIIDQGSINDEIKLYEDKILELHDYLTYYAKYKNLIENSDDENYISNLNKIWESFNKCPFQYFYLFGLDSFAKEIPIMYEIKKLSENRLKNKLLMEFKNNSLELNQYQIKELKNFSERAQFYHDQFLENKNDISELIKKINQKIKNTLIVKIQKIVETLHELLNLCKKQINEAVESIRKGENLQNAYYLTFMQETIEKIFNSKKKIIENQLEQCSNSFDKLIKSIEKIIHSTEISQQIMLKNFLAEIKIEVSQKKSEILKKITERWNQLIEFIEDHGKLMNINFLLDYMLFDVIVFRIKTFFSRKPSNKEFYEKNSQKLDIFRLECDRKCNNFEQMLMSDEFNHEIKDLGAIMNNLHSGVTSFEKDYLVLKQFLAESIKEVEEKTKKIKHFMPNLFY